MRQQILGTRRRDARRKLLEAPRFELVPVPSAFERAVQLPAGTTVTVTASPRRGTEATVEFVEALAARGYACVPHLSARQLQDETELAAVLGRLSAAGVRDLFVVGGDADGSTGAFPDGLALLKAIDVSGYRFERIGVPSYPEGHPHIDTDTLWETLANKQVYANYTITQMCFDAKTILRFVAAARARGIDMPVVAGIPGVTTVSKLLKMSMQVGVGDSARFVRKNHSAVRQLLSPRGYRPDGLVRALSSGPTDPECELSGVHIYTFNEFAATAQWLHRARGMAAMELATATELSTTAELATTSNFTTTPELSGAREGSP